MAYDTIEDKLSSISWNLKRIADGIEQLADLEYQKNQPEIKSYKLARLLRDMKL